MKKKSPVPERTKLLNLIMEKGYSLSTREKMANHFKNTAEEDKEAEASKFISLMNQMSEAEVLKALNL